MIKHNKNWKKTHQRLQNIMYAELKNLPPEKITVSHLCQVGQINRSTFYAHYLDIFDLLEQTEQEKRQALMVGFREEVNHRKMSFLDSESLLQFLIFIRENGWFYKIVLQTRQHFPVSEGFDELNQLLFNHIKVQQPEISDDDLMYFFVAFQSSFTMILRHWSEENYQKDPKELVNIIINSLPKIIFDSHFG